MKESTSRRTFLKYAAGAGAFSLAAPYVKTSHSAGSLSLGIWDHWVPGVNAVLENICAEWGAANGPTASARPERRPLTPLPILLQ